MNIVDFILGMLTGAAIALLVVWIHFTARELS